MGRRQAGCTLLNCQDYDHQCAVWVSWSLADEADASSPRPSCRSSRPTDTCRGHFRTEACPP
eukprot:12924367-Prorocentrum_lima.AAC.1